LEASRAAGPKVRAEHVDVVFLAGSLIIDVIIRTPTGSSSTMVLSNLAKSEDMVEHIAKSLREIPDIATITTGYVIASFQTSPHLQEKPEAKDPASSSEDNSIFNIGAVVGAIAVVVSVMGLFCLFVKYQRPLQKRNPPSNEKFHGIIPP